MESRYDKFKKKSIKKSEQWTKKFKVTGNRFDETEAYIQKAWGYKKQNEKEKWKAIF